MIDWARVDELRSEVGEDAFDEVLDLFLEEVDEAMARLPDVSDPESLAADLHFVRGSALNLGLKEFCTACRTVESALARGESAQIGALIDCYNSSKDMLLAHAPRGHSNVA